MSQSVSGQSSYLAPMKELIRIERLHLADFDRAGVAVHVLRDDLIHPVISGNKWYKLKGWLGYSKSANPLLSFGGAFSNHLAAVAYFSYLNQKPSVGIIRGTHVDLNNSVLKQCTRWGMEIRLMEREDYDQLALHYEIAQDEFPEYHVIPMGGDGPLGTLGVRLHAEDLEGTFDFAWMAVGTGTTLTGFSLGLPNTKCLGVDVVGDDNLQSNVHKLWVEEAARLERDFKFEPEIIGNFGHRLGRFHAGAFETFAIMKAQGIVLDHNYTSKALYELRRLISEGMFERGTKILFVHTGGTIGNEGFEKRHESKIR